MHVYTPPGYEKSRDAYPVFYLLHGAFDGDDSWSTVGRAGFIVDNLIASGAAKPMIVVMPDGHTARFGGAAAGSIPPTSCASSRPTSSRTSRARIASAKAARPRPSRACRWAARRRSTSRSAIPTTYGYVGVFSSGVFGIDNNADWENAHSAQLDDAAAKRDLQLVWFSTGKDDFLLGTTKATVAMLKKHGFDVVYEESKGGHTWINWREYLAKFAPQLFR